MIDLKQLEQNLIEAAKKQQEAIDVAQDAAIEYEVEFEAVAKLNPMLDKLLKERNAAQEAAKVAKEDYATIKARTVEDLTTVTNPEDYKALDAFSYHRKKDVAIVEHGLVEQLIKMGLTRLLLPNVKMINNFVAQNAILAGDTYELPKWLLEHWDYRIGVCAKIKPTIEHAAIKKLIASK